MSNEDLSIHSLLPVTARAIRAVLGSSWRMLKSFRNRIRLEHRETGCNPSLCHMMEGNFPLNLLHPLQLETPTSEDGWEIFMDRYSLQKHFCKRYLEPRNLKIPFGLIFLFLSPAEVGGQLPLWLSSLPWYRPSDMSILTPRLLQGYVDAREFLYHRHQNGLVNHCFFSGVMRKTNLLNT